MSAAYSQYSTELQSIKKQIDNDINTEVLSHLKKIEKTNQLPYNKAYTSYLIAKYLDKNNEHDKSYQYYLKAKKQFISIDSINKAISINLEISDLIVGQDNKAADYKMYLNEYIAYAEKTNNILMLAKANASIATHKILTTEVDESLHYFKIALNLNKKVGDKKLQSFIDNNLAVLYNENFNKPDSALYYLKKDLDYLKTTNNVNYICENYVTQAGSYYYLGDHKKAIEYLKKADKLPIKQYVVKTKQYIYEFLSKNYEEINDYQNAYKYLTLNQAYKDSINETEQNIAINDIQTKYKTKEKELENTVLKGTITTNRILLYTFTGLFIASLIIAFLIYKNSKRREKISLQEKLIEQQKLEKALKDYELHSIDLMLEGQEKERQRIANDLHDNLGSMLAALKLNFENLKLRKNELQGEENKLYERTDELIEEAYQKVRRLAHAKNAGVFANEGLIPAIKKLAEKLSIPGKLQIQVIAFGFTERLENALEIAIFRTIQELSTNVIKHSNASEATIHLTNHEDNINIIIEDNGIGFNRTAIKTADGMGLQTIQKKITQLGGTLTIDATPGKGTTIIIDIPI